ncbi:hypothetical protein ONZ45_g5842 [Pleurotus djamor]|nr:hypothetical protein ONZ45_g5842 [Pleurotus djamor]
MQETQSLPPELWRQIVQELDSPHRNDLHPLLTVCHIFHDVLIRLVYETIFIDGYELLRGYSVAERVIEPWSTHLDISRAHFLSATLQNKPHLARMVTSFVDMRRMAYSESPTQHILPHLTNLRRLHISCAEENDILALPSSLVLTHLSLPNHDDRNPSSFKALLASQHCTVTFLRIELIFGPSQFLPSSLPSLHTYACDYAEYWDQLVEIAPIQHFSSTSFRSDWICHPKHVFSNLVSLSISPGFPHLEILKIGCYLNSLQLFRVIVWENDWGSQFGVENLVTASSSSLSYIHFGKSKIGDEAYTYQPGDLNKLWDLYPLLRVIDIAHKPKLAEAGVSRYFRDGRVDGEVFIRPVSVFEAWWEPLRDDIGYVLENV